MSEKITVFKTLSKINVGDKIEKKGNLNYLSWAFAWQVLKENYPNSNYIVYENKDGLNYHHDTKTAWAKVGVAVEGIEHIEYLPVMDFKNKSIPLNAVTSMDVNKTIQRALTKAISRHGLGLYIYAGEDLPIETKDEESSTKQIEKDEESSTKQIEKVEVKQLEQKPQPKVIEKIDENQARALLRLFTSDEHKNDFLATCKISKIEDLPLSWYDKAIDKLSK